MNLTRLFCFAAILMLGGCKKEETNNFASFAGTWQAEYTVESDIGPLTFMFTTYKWPAEMTLNADGTGQVVHQAPNIFFLDLVVNETVSWKQINDDSVSIFSSNSSRTDQMKYEILQIGDNYRKIQGFDDLDDPWVIEMTRK